MGHYAPLLEKHSLPPREVPWGRLQAQGHCFGGWFSRRSCGAVRVKVQRQLLQTRRILLYFITLGRKGEEERTAESADSSGCDGSTDGRRTRAKLAKREPFFPPYPSLNNRDGRQDLESRTSRVWMGHLLIWPREPLQGVPLPASPRLFFRRAFISRP